MPLICQDMGPFYKYVVLASLVHHTEYKFMFPKCVLFFFKSDCISLGCFWFCVFE